MRKTLGRQMAKLLWQCRSKAETVKNLLPTLQGKTIIFGVELDLLMEITDNVVSGRNSEELNSKLIEDFNKGDIQVIASSKKLKQGITLDGVTNCILVSYYGTSTDFIQKLGRIVRFVPDKIANLYILVTEGTFEESWVTKMTVVRDANGRVLYDVELNVM
jgi:superfamily II DNA or RNA helicase